MSRLLLTCRQCDRLYGMRWGTTAAAYRARRLPGRWTGKPTVRPDGKTLPGKTLKVSAKRAAEIFGVDGVML